MRVGRFRAFQAAIMVVFGLLIPRVGVSANVGAQLPNLKPIGPVSVFIDVPDEGDGTALRIASKVENVGLFPFEVRARGTGSQALELEAEQCVNWQALVCFAWEPAGQLTYEMEPLDQCWAIREFMAYDLRVLDENGTPRWDDGALLVRTLASRVTVDGAPDWDYPNQDEFPLPAYAACAGFAREGLSPGWVVSWDDDIIGQGLPLAGIADGTYALVVTVDPLGNFAETSEFDNDLVLKVRISNGGTSAGLLR